MKFAKMKRRRDLAVRGGGWQSTWDFADETQPGTREPEPVGCRSPANDPRFEPMKRSEASKSTVGLRHASLAQAHAAERSDPIDLDSVAPLIISREKRRDVEAAALEARNGR